MEASSIWNPNQGYFGATIHASFTVFLGARVDKKAPSLRLRCLHSGRSDTQQWPMSHFARISVLGPVGCLIALSALSQRGASVLFLSADEAKEISSFQLPGEGGKPFSEQSIDV